MPSALSGMLPVARRRRCGRALNRHQRFRERRFLKAHAKPATVAIALHRAVRSRAAKHLPTRICPSPPTAMLPPKIDCRKPTPYQGCQGRYRKTIAAEQTVFATPLPPAGRNLRYSVIRTRQRRSQSALHCRSGDADTRSVAGQRRKQLIGESWSTALYPAMMRFGQNRCYLYSWYLPTSTFSSTPSASSVNTASEQYSEIR